jgi:hypothetical protein
VNHLSESHLSRARGRARRTFTCVASVVGLLLVAAACQDVSTIVRPDEPIVLTGSQLTALLGTEPDRIVAFRHTRDNETNTTAWTQIPVQVDERKVVDFGSQPANNTTPGVNGTVYGTSPIGVTALQYADPNTFVGADSDPTFDADDELVFMSDDAGGAPRYNEKSEPTGIVPGSGVQVHLNDTLGAKAGYVYLFESAGSLDPSAGQDYVDYDFNLTSGAYKSTYKRADGPNPETSTVTTDNYRIGFGDRWIEDQWRVDVGGASGADVLDGVKARFGLDTCGRSNATFADAEGAFIANLDGPVRAIRSYIGANSGPLTQRTHKLYRDQEITETDLRVHAIPGIMDYVDYSTAAIGMTYANSAHPGGVPIDGAADAISSAVPSWELVTGAQGSVMVAGTVDTSVVPDGGTLDDIVDGFYRDELNSPVNQCWGDPHFLGSSGLDFVTPIPNTDPRALPFDDFSATRIVRFAAPGASTADAETWSAGIGTPIVTSINPAGL